MQFSTGSLARDAHLNTAALHFLRALPGFPSPLDSR
jgi:hypothetical protein